MFKNDFVKKYFNVLGKIFICFAFAFLFVFSLGQNDLKKSFALNDALPYATNQLSGQTWLLNDTLYPSSIVSSTTTSKYFDVSVSYDNVNYNRIRFRYNSSNQFIVELIKIDGSIPMITIYFDGWRYDSRVIDFGYSSSDLSRLVQWLGYNGVLYEPNIYNITINLHNGIYGSTTATIEEDTTLTLEYSVLSDNVFSGFVFDYGDNLVTDKVGDGRISVTGNYESISIIIYDVTSDLSFTINSVEGRSLIGEWYLDYDLFVNSDLESINVNDVIARPFVSNDITFNRIYRNSSLNTFVYDDTSDIEKPVVNVFSFLSGLYLPVNTYNYLLIDISFNENYQNYVPASSMFFNFFRIATNEDIARVNQLNEQLIIQSDNTNFISLFGAILDAQFGTLKSLLNFYIFDINIWSLVTFFLTIVLIFIVFKIIKGGSSDGKKS